MKTFHDFYSNSNFNNFKDCLVKNYKVVLVATQFGSYLIAKNNDSYFEIKFDIDFDNEADVEAANIVNLAVCLNGLKTVDINFPYYEEKMSNKKVVRKGLFRKKSIENTEVLFTKRDKGFISYETIIHDELLSSYVEYPA